MNNFKGCFFLFFISGLQVDVHQGIQFVNDDINIVSSNSCRNNRNIFAFIQSSMTSKLTVLTFVGHLIEEVRYKLYPILSTNNNNFMSKLIRTIVQMLTPTFWSYKNFEGQKITQKNYFWLM